jgi:hypothetical protein
MANIARLNVVVAGDAAGMNRAMKQAAGAVRGLQSSVKNSAGKINGLLGGIGVGLGLAGLQSMAKNAIEDTKGQVLLAAAMRNTAGATDEQVTATEQFITQLQNQTAIVDDELRPAMSMLLRQTGDVATAQSLLALATDVSAGSGKDLAAVSKAVGMAYQGNYTQLIRLGLVAKDTKDPLGDLQKSFEGMGAAAADNDPYKQMAVIFGELSETIGQYLMPYLSAFTDWLTSDDGQEKLQMLADGFGMIFTNLSNIISFLADNTWIVGTIGALYALVKVWRLLNTVMRAAYAITKGNTIAKMALEAVSSAKGWAALGAAAIAIGAGVAAFATIDSLLGTNDDGGTITIPKQKKLEIPTPKEYKPKGLKGVGPGSGGGASKTIDDTKKILQAGIETLRAKLTAIRNLINEFGAKFRSSVSVAFGIVERGAGKLFRADRYVKELNRMKKALSDYGSNLAKLRAMGGSKALPLINELLGMSPEDGAAAMRAFAESPALFSEAVNASNSLGVMGRAVGLGLSTTNGDPTQNLILNEMKLLRGDLAKGKNTYNIKATMTAQQILAAIRSYEKSTGKRVLVG